ncbi:MAG: hypothetical protein AUK47_23615 [Deltaproteobacteria bacterium CG2_30_63_29]|nr:MAG: hypothetical protein AUK47_23615 [Deltaproteobacteria bacterium CG2_30_63_29]PJB38248.1 MAG: hypothetical protein CO108_19320 [Deltaproteobacteria bacterium CG_4_9_14_3_um_filter_63_12]
MRFAIKSITQEVLVRRLLGLRVFGPLAMVTMISVTPAFAENGIPEGVGVDSCAHVKSRICELCSDAVCTHSLAIESSDQECQWVLEFIEQEILAAWARTSAEDPGAQLDERSAAAGACLVLEQGMSVE